MIIPVNLMFKSEQKINNIDCKIFCNGIQYPYAVSDQGEHFDIYRNVNLFFLAVNTVFDCNDRNELALLWNKKPEIDSEIDDIEIDYLYIDKPKLLSQGSFYHTQTSELLERPNEFGTNHWSPATWINNPGIFYLTFSLPIEQWCFND